MRRKVELQPAWLKMKTTQKRHHIKSNKSYNQYRSVNNAIINVGKQLIALGRNSLSYRFRNCQEDTQPTAIIFILETSRDEPSRSGTNQPSRKRKYVSQQTVVNKVFFMSKTAGCSVCVIQRAGILCHHQD